jgi:hypothetical protein
MTMVLGFGRFSPFLDFSPLQSVQPSLARETLEYILPWSASCIPASRKKNRLRARGEYQSTEHENKHRSKLDPREGPTPLTMTAAVVPSPTSAKPQRTHLPRPPHRRLLPNSLRPHLMSDHRHPHALYDAQQSHSQLSGFTRIPRGCWNIHLAGREIPIPTPGCLLFWCSGRISLVGSR